MVYLCMSFFQYFIDTPGATDKAFSHWKRDNKAHIPLLWDTLSIYSTLARKSNWTICNFLKHFTSITVECQGGLWKTLGVVQCFSRKEHSALCIAWKENEIPTWNHRLNSEKMVEGKINSHSYHCILQDNDRVDICKLKLRICLMLLDPKP